MSPLSVQHQPNVLAHSYCLDTGTTVTFFKATPGATTPRMQMQLPDGDPVDCGAVEAPERFGPYATPAEFKSWVERFAAMA